jgi:hypothetical protein
MKSLRTLVFAVAALTIPVASFAQNSATPADTYSQSTTAGQPPQQANMDNPNQQQQAASASTYGAPMNGSYAAGHKMMQPYGPAIFEHH